MSSIFLPLFCSTYCFNKKFFMAPLFLNIFLNNLCNVINYSGAWGSVVVKALRY